MVERTVVYMPDGVPVEMHKIDGVWTSLPYAIPASIITPAASIPVEPLIIPVDPAATVATVVEPLVIQTSFE